MLVLRLVALAVFVLQHLFIGQLHKEISSLTKLMAATPAEPVHVPKTTLDVTEDFIVYFNSFETNGTLQFGTNAGTIHVAKDFPHTSQASFHEAPRGDTITTTEQPKTWKFWTSLVAGFLGVFCLVIMLFWDIIPDEPAIFSATYVADLDETARERAIYVTVLESTARDTDSQHTALESDYIELKDKYGSIVKSIEKLTGLEELQGQLSSGLQQFQKMKNENEKLKAENQELMDNDPFNERVRRKQRKSKNQSTREKQQLTKQRDSAMANALSNGWTVEEDSDDGETPTPTDSSDPPSGPKDNGDNDGDGEGSTDSTGADKNGDGSSTTGDEPPQSFDKTGGPPGGPKDPSPGDNEPEPSTTPPPTTSNTGSSPEEPSPGNKEPEKSSKSPPATTNTDSTSERSRSRGSKPDSVVKPATSPTTSGTSDDSQPQGSKLPVPAPSKGERDEEMRGKAPPTQPKAMRQKDATKAANATKRKTPPGNPARAPKGTPAPRPDFSIPSELGSMFRKDDAGPAPK